MNKPSTTELINTINSCLKKTKITKDNIDKDLLEMGIDSVEFISVIVKLEETYDFEFPDEKLTMAEMHSVRGIIAIIHALE